MLNQATPDIPDPHRTLKVVRTVSSVRRLSRATRGPVVLVPTMGALHAGHAALIDRARKLAGTKGAVVVSIFVNPTQFGPKEDLSRYPRPFATDCAVCKSHGADIVFHPSAAEMYPSEASTMVEETSVSRFLCGASRPGHFRGVCTIVLKLFNAIGPTVAVFGRKDFQQCAVIQRMVRDLDLPVRIVTAPTVREPDGLALSSRNSYLAPQERAEAPVIRRSLQSARQAARGGESSAAALRKLITKMISEKPSARIDYVEIVNAETLEPTPEASPGTLIAVAAFFGTTRLIDNILI